MPIGGYEIVVAEEPNEKTLARIPYLALGLNPRFRSASPLLAPTLCREFAAIDANDQEAIRVFASLHGSLGGYETQRGYKLYETGGRGFVLVDRLTTWQYEIRHVRNAIALIDQMLFEPDRLPESISWGNDGIALLRNPNEWTHQARHFSGERPDLVECARLLALDMVNYGLEETTSGRLVRDKNKIRHSIQPNGLLGAIWLQIAEILEGRAVDRLCDGCGRWFRLVPGEDRLDRRYCKSPAANDTNACRQRALVRRREAEAQNKLESSGRGSVV